MPTGDQREEFDFRITGPVTEQNTVPASVLIQVLGAAQKSIYLLALLQEGREIRERARIPDEIEEKYKLVCEPPQPGSYCVPTILGDLDAGLIPSNGIQQVAEKFRAVGEAITTGIATGSFQKLDELLPVRQFRNKILETFKSMSPVPGSGWELTISVNSEEFVRFNDDTTPLLQHALKRPEAVGQLQTITGKVSKIDFVKRVITIIYPVTSRELDCHYDESIEEVLLENRRGLIQVTGYVILDDDDIPKSISEVVSINDLDLSPFRLASVPFRQGELNLREPLVAHPVSSESFQLLSLREESLGVDVYATTREGLVIELYEQLAMLWQEYALAEDAILTPEAKKLKQALKARIEEREHAAK